METRPTLQGDALPGLNSHRSKISITFRCCRCFILCFNFALYFIYVGTGLPIGRDREERGGGGDKNETQHGKLWKKKCLNRMSRAYFSSSSTFSSSSSSFSSSIHLSFSISIYILYLFLSLFLFLFTSHSLFPSLSIFLLIARQLCPLSLSLFLPLSMPRFLYLYTFLSLFVAVYDSIQCGSLILYLIDSPYPSIMCVFVGLCVSLSASLCLYCCIFFFLISSLHQSLNSVPAYIYVPLALDLSLCLHVPLIRSHTYTHTHTLSLNSFFSRYPLPALNDTLTFFYLQVS